MLEKVFFKMPKNVIGKSSFNRREFVRDSSSEGLREVSHVHVPYAC